MIVIFGCKINKTKNRMREGLWIETYTIDSSTYKSKGKYKNDEEIKTWRYFKNKKIQKIEQYKNNVCYVTTYYPNGKIESKGQTKVTNTPTQRHWFYFGAWIFYNEKEQIYLIKTYENGVSIREKNIL